MESYSKLAGLHLKARSGGGGKQCERQNKRQRLGSRGEVQKLEWIVSW